MGIGSNLGKYRNRLNLTRKEVADKIGVSLSTYTNYEAGNRSPHVDLLPKLAAALQVSIDQLLGYTRPTMENEVYLIQWAGLEVKEEGGLYSLSGLKPGTWEMLDLFEKEYLSEIKPRLNLAPLPAVDFDRAVKIARQQVIDEYSGRFILWILKEIDHQNYLKAQEKKEVPPYERTRKKPPAHE